MLDAAGAFNLSSSRLEGGGSVGEELCLTAASAGWDCTTIGLAFDSFADGEEDLVPGGDVRCCAICSGLGLGGRDARRVFLEAPFASTGVTLHLEVPKL